MCELSWVDDFKLEQKDIIAEVLQLQNKKVINVNEDGIIVNKDFDRTKLKQSQQYILDSIRNGKINIVDELVLKEKVKEDSLQDGLIEEKNDLKRRQIKRIVISIIVLVFARVIEMLMFLVLSRNIVMFFAAVMFSIALTLYPIIAIISFIATTVKYKMDPYFRTEKGKNLNREIEGLKAFLKDYTLLDEKDKDAVVVWEEYLAYSVLFNHNKKIVEQYKKYME